MKMQLERKINLQLLSFRKQQGVAAVWMGLLLVPIMGVTFWAVEGTRYVQETSRLRDSAEAAAIAVTIEDQPDLARGLASQYVENYVRDIKSANLSTQRFHQAEDEGAGVLEYIQYTVNAKTTHDSWFASRFIPSFDEQQVLAGRSLARKYSTYLGDNNIDLAFVLDFSGSMALRWGVDNTKKIDDLKTAVDQISRKLLCTSTRRVYVEGEWQEVCAEPKEANSANKLLNRVGFAPFNVRTREKIAKYDTNVTSQLSYKSNYNNYLSPYSYNDLDWVYWSQYSKQQIRNCAYNKLHCDEPRQDNYDAARRIMDVFRLTRITSPDVFDYVDFPTTLSTMFTDKSALKSNFYHAQNNALFKWHGASDPMQFYTLPMSNKLSDVGVINRMWPSGGTSAYQGILRGLQILNDGNPHSDNAQEQQAYDSKVKMLLILSDGEENPPNGILKELVDRGMCNQAREAIPGLYIGVIGIDFDASNQFGFQDCVVDPNEDIIDVSNLDELIEKIEELIRKGSKTSGTTKLY